MEIDNMIDIVSDVLKDLDAIKTEDILGSKEKFDMDNDIENTINNFDISNMTNDVDNNLDISNMTNSVDNNLDISNMTNSVDNNFDISNMTNDVDNNLDIEAIINEITSTDNKEEKNIDKFYNNIDVFSLDEERENIPFEQSTDDLSVYFQEEDTKNLLNQEYIAATNENAFLNVDDEVKIKKENKKEETNQEKDITKPEYKEIKVREQKEEMILKKDILFEKAYNDILDLVIYESKKSFNSLEEENKMNFSQLINKLEAYHKAKEDIFKDIKKTDKTIFDETIERI